MFGIPVKCLTKGVMHGEPLECSAMQHPRDSQITYIISHDKPGSTSHQCQPYGIFFSWSESHFR